MRTLIRECLVSIEEFEEFYDPEWVCVTDRLPNRKAKLIRPIKGHDVKASSTRYRLFYESRVCVACGLEGEYFALERHPDVERCHLNLYAEVDGEEILFTRDHIVAQSNGGKDHLDNYQTMCEPCNMMKADLDNELPPEMRELVWYHQKVDNVINRRSRGKVAFEIHPRNWGWEILTEGWTPTPIQLLGLQDVFGAKRGNVTGAGDRALRICVVTKPSS